MPPFTIQSGRFVKECIGICNYKADATFSWGDNFPPVYGHTSVSYLKHCPGFAEAKHGDMQAADHVVKMCVKPHRLAELKKKHPGAVLLPIMAHNRLPEALAQQIGLKMHTGVYQLKSQSRKSLSAMQRLLHKPHFSGKIDKGVNYIIVDDVVTQGGTISALRKYVMFGGGAVVGVSSLAFSADSRVIAPDAQDIQSLINKFTYTLITDLLNKYNIADDVWELTRPQVRCLLRFEKIGHIVSSIERINDEPDELISPAAYPAGALRELSTWPKSCLTALGGRAAIIPSASLT